MYLVFDSLSEPCELLVVRVDTELLWYAVIARDKNCQVGDSTACINASELESGLHNPRLPKRRAHRFLELWSAVDMELWLPYGGHELSDTGSV